MRIIVFENTISKNENQEIIRVRNMINKATTALPARPTKRPNKEIVRKESNGKYIINKYIH